MFKEILKNAAGVALGTALGPVAALLIAKAFGMLKSA